MIMIMIMIMKMIMIMIMIIMIIILVNFYCVNSNANIFFGANKMVFVRFLRVQYKLEI